jgi:AAA domain
MDVRTADNAELDHKVIQLDRKGRFLLFCELATHSSREWLVHNLLGHGEASAMYGKPGDGKSVLAEDLALHIAAGWPWHGRPVRRGGVLYIALERRKLVERRAIALREISSSVRHAFDSRPWSQAQIRDCHSRHFRARTGFALPGAPRCASYPR